MRLRDTAAAKVNGSGKGRFKSRLFFRVQRLVAVAHFHGRPLGFLCAHMCAGSDT